MNIAFISNLPVKSFLSNLFIQYSQTQNLDIEHFMYCTEYDMDAVGISKCQVVVIYLDFHDKYNYLCKDILENKYSRSEAIKIVITQMEQLYGYVKSISNARIIWFGFENFFSEIYQMLGSIRAKFDIIDDINIELFDKLSKENDVLIDLKRIIAQVGQKNSFDLKQYRRWNWPFSRAVNHIIVEEVLKQIRIEQAIGPKCIVLDCDNVLWGGIISEDGIDNIKLGSYGLGKLYKEFQEFLVWMYDFGVILAICSKNNYEDIINVLDNHSEVILKKKYISLIMANWNSKTENILAISKELNIGLDQMVFLDDSLAEIHEIKKRLPDVISLQFNILEAYKFSNLFNLQINDYRKVLDRQSTYLNNKRRMVLKHAVGSYEKYLEELKTSIVILESSENEVARLAELINRTNKFTNGRRYTIAELKDKMKDSSYIFKSIYVKDIYQDFGLVGAIMIKDRNCLDVCCLSCRVLGRRVEEYLINYIKKPEFNVTKLYFKNTSKNNEFLKKVQDEIANLTIL